MKNVLCCDVSFQLTLQSVPPLKHVHMIFYQICYHWWALSNVTVSQVLIAFSGNGDASSKVCKSLVGLFFRTLWIFAYSVFRGMSFLANVARTAFESILLYHLFAAGDRGYIFFVAMETSNSVW